MLTEIKCIKGLREDNVLFPMFNILNDIAIQYGVVVISSK